MNPDFAVEIVARVLNAKQISISGYFLGEKIVNYFEVKKCSEKLSCKVFGSRSRFLIAKSGLKDEPAATKLDDDFIAFLLKGPVFNEKDIQISENNRKSIATWQKKS